ncbi:unnamed protein product [Toxocara canis]|uniref:Transmembrane protein n=1 Tax=Toxocara canis TaxID=6265 RepID=A0A183UD88_TOXCA|nr:unnamed protein product [Toxocara canis]
MCEGVAEEKDAKKGFCHDWIQWLTGCRMITTMVERTLEKELKRIVENLKKDLASGFFYERRTFSWNVGCNGPTVEHLEFGEGTQLTGGHRRIEMGFGMNAAGEVNRKLTPEEVQFLLQKLSSDEQKELGQVLKKCTTEMTLTRGVARYLAHGCTHNKSQTVITGLPFAAAVIGSLYLARQRLPTALHFGPKKWPFYFVVGIGALTTANLLSISTCAERIHPHLNALWQKEVSPGERIFVIQSYCEDLTTINWFQYSSENTSVVSYDDLRRRNREAVSLPNTDHVSVACPEDTSGVSLGVSQRADNVSRTGLVSEQLQPVPSAYSGDVNRKSAHSRPPAFTYDEQPSYMSGTPVGAPKKTQYGDEGFS